MHDRDRAEHGVIGGLAMKLVPREIRGDGLVEAIEYLESLQTTSTDDLPMRCERPIFLLSAGWRSGSTLLQRLICSDETTLMWGEPFGDRIPVCRLAASLAGFSETDPHNRYAIDEFSGEFSRQWVANLNPGFGPLRAAHLAYFEHLLSEPAAAAGFDNWGAKWVRLSGHHARYLRWLYPKSRIVFLVRHPLQAYLSYKKKRWYTIRPNHRVSGSVRFMAHWRFLANSFLSQAESVGALLIRYEDLVGNPETLDRLEAHLDIPIRREILSHPVGARRKEKLRICWWERLVAASLAGTACRSLGYVSTHFGNKGTDHTDAGAR